MSRILLFVLLCVSSTGWTQSLRQAGKYFENFEYKRAAKAYEAVAKDKELSLDNYKRLAYSYFLSGDYEKCLPLSDSIINTHDAEPMFYYINGEVNMGNRNYEKAKESFQKYSQLDDEFDVQNKIASCGQIPTWEQEVYLKNSLMSGNDTKADISGQRLTEGTIVYKEVGTDSSGLKIDRTNIDNSELIIARPFLSTSTGELQEISFSDSTLKNSSISSIWIEDSQSKVWVTVNKPLGKDPIDLAHHLYTGDFDPESYTISQVELWSYGGYNDSSACAHATVNASNNRMVFTKIGPSTNGADLYMSKRVNGVWEAPAPLADLNTNGDDMYPMFIGDSLLSFSSNGKPGYGNLDVFIADVSDGLIGEVRHLKSPVNSFMDDFNFHYMASQDSAVYTSNRYTGVGDDDRYFVKFSEPVVEPVAVDSSEFNEFVDNWEVPKLYFEFDKVDILDVEKLDSLVKFLENYPKSSITVEGHTDSRGSIDYNYDLGYKRANEVKAALVKAGVSEGQIITQSKGKTDPQDDCKWCTEAQHAKNRVVLVLLNGK